MTLEDFFSPRLARVKAMQEGALQRQLAFEQAKPQIDLANQTQQLQNTSPMSLSQADLVRSVTDAAKLGGRTLSSDEVNALMQSANAQSGPRTQERMGQAIQQGQDPNTVVGQGQGGVGNRFPVTPTFQGPNGPYTPPSLLSSPPPSTLMNSDDRRQFLQNASMTQAQKDQLQAQQAQQQALMQAQEFKKAGINPPQSVLDATSPQNAPVSLIDKPGASTQKESKTQMGVIIDRADELGLQGRARYDFIAQENMKQQAGLVSAKAQATQQAAANDPIVKTLGDKMGNGTMINFKDLGAMRNNKAQIYAYVTQKYPNIDITKMDKNVDFMGDNTLNRMTTQVNSVLPRLEKFGQAFDSLKNGQFPTMNALQNWILKQTGDPRIVDVLTNRNSVVLEALRAMSGSQGASDLRAILELNNLDPNSSPAQMKAAFNNIMGALNSIKDARNLLPYPDWAGPIADKTGAAQGSGPKTANDWLKSKGLIK